MQLAAKMTFNSVETDSDDERVNDRTRVRLPAALHGDAQAIHDLTVHDLSADGFSAIVDHPLPVGRQCHIMLGDSVMRAAEIVRQDGPRFAARFVASLTPDELRRAIGASPVVWGEFVGAPSFVRAAATDVGATLQSTDTRWPRPVRAAVMIGLPVVMWSILLTVMR